MTLSKKNSPLYNYKKKNEYTLSDRDSQKSPWPTALVTAAAAISLILISQLVFTS
ncbi:hypothetical protein [Polycladidibacter stylochi]|uniref:hypothetical protein n=1 Tax=Polycladidibacter stylochi TaxID=1807766 RepID=UPI000B335C0E|nr:hypothetical protein [Pseudovibrio stylochi]